MHIIVVIFFGLLGAFYMFGGYAVVRAIAMDRLMDTAIERINLSGEASEKGKRGRFKSLFFCVMAIVTFAGGAFLLFQSALATMFFCICLVMQLLHTLVLGPKYFDLDEGDDLQKAGRRATVKAMVIYWFITLFLLFVQNMGVLPSFLSPWSQRETAGLFVTIAFAIYAIRLVQIPNFRSDSGAQQPNDQELYTDALDHGLRNGPAGLVDLTDLAELRVQAVEHEDGLWARSLATDIWQAVQADQIGLSVSLELKISQWEDIYDRFWEMEQSEELNDRPRCNDAEKQTHFEDAVAIARLVKGELASTSPDEMMVTWVNEEGEALEV